MTGADTVKNLLVNRLGLIVALVITAPVWVPVGTLALLSVPFVAISFAKRAIDWALSAI